MKKHNNYRYSAIKILLHHYDNDTRLYESIDYIINSNVNNKNSIIFIVQGVIRKLSSIDLLLEKLIKNYYHSIPINVKTILRVGIFQIKEMNSPNYATIDVLVECTKKYNKKFFNLVNAVLRKSISYKINIDKDSIENQSKILNHPKWMYQKWIKNYGIDYANNLIKWNNEIPTIWFRINSNYYNKKSFEILLIELNIKFSTYKYNTNYYKINEPNLIINHQVFKDGLVSIQNPFSGFVCKMLKPNKNDTIIDACAAPGGKTAYLAELMHNSGRIIAYDVRKDRIDLLNKTIDRLNIKNVHVQLLDSSRCMVPKVDKILIDAPCTGTGVISKYPDIKWRKKNKDINRMNIIQTALLSNLSKHLKRGGKIVYSTCSVEKEENENIINTFLKNNKNFKINNIETIIPKNFINKFGMFETIPFKDKIDGGFAVSIVKNAN